MPILALSLAATLTLIAAFHLYWGLGGRVGWNVVIPKDLEGQPLFKPGFGACLVVAIGLLATAGVCLMGGELIARFISLRTIKIILYLCAAGFFLRAMGDRRYVGLFRKIKSSDFAKMDRRFFTPLCFGLSIGLCALAHGIG